MEYPHEVRDAMAKEVMGRLGIVEDCVICGESLDGEIAEMHNPLKAAFVAVAGPSPDEWFGGSPQEGLVHAQCGIDAGWEIS